MLTAAVNVATSARKLVRSDADGETKHKKKKKKRIGEETGGKKKSFYTNKKCDGGNRRLAGCMRPETRRVTIHAPENRSFLREIVPVYTQNTVLNITLWSLPWQNSDWYAYVQYSHAISCTGQGQVYTATDVADCDDDECTSGASALTNPVRAAMCPRYAQAAHAFVPIHNTINTYYTRCKK